MESSPKATKPAPFVPSELTLPGWRKRLSVALQKEKGKPTFPLKLPVPPLLGNMTPLSNEVSKLAEAYAEILETTVPGALQKPGLKDTPRRAAKAFVELMSAEGFDFTVFEEEHSDEMIIQNGIVMHSLCEHHILPFFGTACVAYIPDGNRIVGLSKLSRLVRYCSAGLNTQERITRAIGTFMQDSVLAPKGVAVSLRCFHTCMSLRGVKDTNAVTLTQALFGVFKTDPAARAEFLSRVQHQQIYQ